MDQSPFREPTLDQMIWACSDILVAKTQDPERYQELDQRFIHGTHKSLFSNACVESVAETRKTFFEFSQDLVAIKNDQVDGDSLDLATALNSSGLGAALIFVGSTGRGPTSGPPRPGPEHQRGDVVHWGSLGGQFHPSIAERARPLMLAASQGCHRCRAPRDRRLLAIHVRITVHETTDGT